MANQRALPPSRRRTLIPSGHRRCAGGSPALGCALPNAARRCARPHRRGDRAGCGPNERFHSHGGCFPWKRNFVAALRTPDARSRLPRSPTSAAASSRRCRAAAENGRLGAGLLCAVDDQGRAPTFDLVTGKKHGRLTAPFALPGLAYDTQRGRRYTKRRPPRSCEASMTAALFDAMRWPTMLRFSKTISGICRHRRWPHRLGLRNRRLLAGGVSTDLECAGAVNLEHRAIAREGIRGHAGHDPAGSCWRGSADPGHSRSP